MCNDGDVNAFASSSQPRLIVHKQAWSRESASRNARKHRNDNFQGSIETFYNCVGCACEFMLPSPSSQNILSPAKLYADKEAGFSHIFMLPWHHFLLASISEFQQTLDWMETSLHEYLTMMELGNELFPLSRRRCFLCSRCIFSLPSKDMRFCSKHSMSSAIYVLIVL